MKRTEDPPPPPLETPLQRCIAVYQPAGEHLVQWRHTGLNQPSPASSKACVLLPKLISTSHPGNQSNVFLDHRHHNLCRRCCLFLLVLIAQVLQFLQFVCFIVIVFLTMPFKCCVPGCKGNYKIGLKVHVFSFPSNKEVRRKWRNAIPRKDF